MQGKKSPDLTKACHDSLVLSALLVSGVELSFKTRSPDGLLLCAFSPGTQEEFLAIQMKGGRPYFLFDPQVHEALHWRRVKDWVPGRKTMLKNKKQKQN